MTSLPSYDGPDLRLNIDSDELGQGFARVVLVVADLIRELLERQSIRRIDAGDLNDQQIERLGTALMEINDQLAAIRAALDERRPRKEQP